jgi:phosphoribosylglycinamide formyltransferase-1
MTPGPDHSTAVGVLVSGSGTNLQALLDATQVPGHPAHVALVISSRKNAQALERARAAGVPAVWISPKRFDTPTAFEQALGEALEEHGVEWVALAGFMRILGPTFLERWTGRVLNIHPSLLPAFPGLDAQGQAHAHGVRIAGATVHFVDAGTDTGPIIAQGAVPVTPGESRDALQQRILKMEHRLYPMVLRWAAENRLSVAGRYVQVDLPPGDAAWLWDNT